MDEREFKMTNETVNIGDMNLDLITSDDAAPYVRIGIDSIHLSAYLTMRQVSNIVNTLTSFLDRASAPEKENSESIVKSFLETNMEVCNVTRSDAPTLLHKLIDASIASPNEDGYYWASITDKCTASMYPICYTKDDEDGWLLPVCFKSKVKWWYPKKLNSIML